MAMETALATKITAMVMRLATQEAVTRITATATPLATALERVPVLALAAVTETETRLAMATPSVRELDHITVIHVF